MRNSSFFPTAQLRYCLACMPPFFRKKSSQSENESSLPSVYIDVGWEGRAVGRRARRRTERRASLNASPSSSFPSLLYFSYDVLFVEGGGDGRGWWERGGGGGGRIFIFRCGGVEKREKSQWRRSVSLGTSDEEEKRGELLFHLALY